jgi:hypothetical protein
MIFLSKLLKISKHTQPQLLVTNKNLNSIYFGIFLLSIFFIKYSVSGLSSLLILVIIYLLKVNSSLEKLETTLVSNNTIYLILPSFAAFTFLLFFIESFLTLFFFIELYGVLYYFCFLTSYNFSNQTILKYKNGLLLLLWNNFLTTLFLALGCFFLVKNSGSTNFSELFYLSTSSCGIYFFIFGFF